MSAQSTRIMLYELFRKFVSSFFESFSLNVDEKLFSVLFPLRFQSSFVMRSNKTTLQISCALKEKLSWDSSHSLSNTLNLVPFKTFRPKRKVFARENMKNLVSKLKLFRKQFSEFKFVRKVDVRDEKRERGLKQRSFIE